MLELGEIESEGQLIVAKVLVGKQIDEFSKVNIDRCTLVININALLKFLKQLTPVTVGQKKLLTRSY